VVVIGIAGVDIETGQALWELANGGEPHRDWLDTAPGDQEIDPAPLLRLAPTQYRSHAPGGQGWSLLWAIH